MLLVLDRESKSIKKVICKIRVLLKMLCFKTYSSFESGRDELTL